MQSLNKKRSSFDPVSEVPSVLTYTCSRSGGLEMRQLPLHVLGGDWGQTRALDMTTADT